MTSDATHAGDPAPTRIRVFLVDDHEIVRRGVADLLESEGDLIVVGEAATVAEALLRVPAVRPGRRRARRPSPRRERRGTLPRTAVLLPGLPCLMLTSFADDDALFDAIMAGASGFVLSRCSVATWSRPSGRSPRTDRCSTPGHRRAAGAHPRSQHDADDPLASLTDQERAVLELIAEGLTNRQIGERMFLAEKTVKNYVSHLLAKLGLQRRTQVAVLATKLHAQGGQTTH